MKHKALTVKHPYSYLICSGVKDIENRSWKCPQKYIGERVLIHASAKWAKESDNLEQFFSMQLVYMRKMGIVLNPGIMPTSAIIGSVIIADCVQNHPSIWAIEGYYHWVLKDPILFEQPILNVKGKLGFWDYELGL